MKYVVRNASPNDLQNIMKIYASARQLMKKADNPNQWGDDYPPNNLIENDISKMHFFVCENKQGDILGVFTYFFGEEDPTYIQIDAGEWLNHSPYGVIHRIASSGKEKGVAQFCINWCYEQSQNLRIDTHRDNKAMHYILEKLEFTKCGIIYIENGDERIAYQKSRI